MPHAHFFEHHFTKIVVALLLTFVSGLVDIVGYLGVFHFFTAHLTGTTVQLGHAIVSRDTQDVLAATSIVAAFVGGSILGRALIEIASRRKIRRIASVTLAIEAILLIVVARAGAGIAPQPYGSLVLLAAAMGIQTATLTGIGPLTVHTTFVTGMMNKVAQLSSHVAFRAYDLSHARAGDSKARVEQDRELQMLALLIGVWLLYAAGAMAGSRSFVSWGLNALLVGSALIGVALVVDLIHPFSIEEEKEQSER